MPAPAAPATPAAVPMGEFTIANPMLAMMAGNMATLATMFQQGGLGQTFTGLPLPQTGAAGQSGAAEQAKAKSEMPDIVYPDIQDYLESIAVDNPRHRDALEGLGHLLVSNDYFGIDDIAGETVEWFMAEPYKLSSGNAKFVVRIVGAEIDRIKREAEGL